MATLAEAVAKDLRSVADKAHVRSNRLAADDRDGTTCLALQLRRFEKVARTIADQVEAGQMEPFDGRHAVQDLFAAFEYLNFGRVVSVPEPRDQFRFGMEGG